MRGWPAPRPRFQRHAAGFDQIEDDIGVNIAAAIVVHRAALQRQAERSID